MVGEFPAGIAGRWLYPLNSYVGAGDPNWSPCFHRSILSNEPSLHPSITSFYHFFPTTLPLSCILSLLCHSDPMTSRCPHSENLFDAPHGSRRDWSGRIGPKGLPSLSTSWDFMSLRYSRATMNTVSSVCRQTHICHLLTL